MKVRPADSRLEELHKRVYLRSRWWLDEGKWHSAFCQIPILIKILLFGVVDFSISFRRRRHHCCHRATICCCSCSIAVDCGKWSNTTGSWWSFHRCCIIAIGIGKKKQIPPYIYIHHSSRGFQTKLYSQTARRLSSSLRATKCPAIITAGYQLANGKAVCASGSVASPMKHHFSHTLLCPIVARRQTLHSQHLWQSRVFCSIIGRLCDASATF